MTSSYDLFIFAGEASGDLHGENLLKSLKTLKPNLKIKGVGGPRMRKAGLDCFLNLEEFEVMGFIDILSTLPRLIRHFLKIRNEILTSKPTIVVLIDYPGFNLRLARSLKQKKTCPKIVHFVCPSVWAWGKRRIPLIEKNLDKLMTILPFEPELFSPSHLNVEYVGHPLISRINLHQYSTSWRTQYGIGKDQVLLSLFPGSRQKEIERNFPIQLKVAKKLLQQRPDMMLAISCSNKKFLPFLKTFDLGNAKIIQIDHSYEMMRGSHLAIATSGTVTLELALHQVPTVVTFGIKPLDLFIATQIFRINLPYYALPNVIAQEEVFPELFGPNLTVESLTDALSTLATSQLRREQCQLKCRYLKTQLGQKNATEEAAKSILSSL